jgi:hypothetical protein
LRAAGAFAAIVLALRLAAAQTFTATSISQAAQQARRDAGRLAHRADNLLRQTVADGFERGSTAVRRFQAERAIIARELSAIFNRRVSEDDWLLVVPTRELDLALAMQPLVIRIVPKPDEVEDALERPLPRIEQQKTDDADAVLLKVVLAALGIGNTDGALVERLKADPVLPSALKATAGAVTARRYGLAAIELEHLLRLLVEPDTIAVLAGSTGGSPRAIYLALIAEFVPFLGWTLMVSLILAAIYQNRDSTAPILR